MKTLRAHLEEDLNLRRKLGFKLRIAGRLLGQFVGFTAENRAAFITRKLALAWATQPAGCLPSGWASRLGVVRRFALYVSASDARTEVPPQELLPHCYHRKPPYLYSDREVRRLLQAIGQVPAPKGLQAIGQATLLGLVAVTGLRVGEAIGLDRKDVDLDRGLLTVRQAKFNKSRGVPIHASTQRQLRAYARQRERICPHPSTPSFFVSERGTRLAASTVRHWFVIASRRIGLCQPTDHRGPRLHDLRHRFAYKTILNWYRRDVDVEVHLPELTTLIPRR